MTEDVDLVRQLVELAVTSGRSHQSPQTSFVHWCHTRGDETVNHTIPLYENFLFCLALMRMRTQQNITEAKEILARLLAFQAEDGNYPVYLHEYPLCRDRYNGAQILVDVSSASVMADRDCLVSVEIHGDKGTIEGAHRFLDQPKCVVADLIARGFDEEI